MKKQLKLSSRPVEVRESPPTIDNIFKSPSVPLNDSPPTNLQGFLQVPEKKLSFSQKFHQQIQKFTFITKNKEFVETLELDKLTSMSRFWFLYRKLKTYAHEIVQQAFSMYQNCARAANDANLEGMVADFTKLEIKDKEAELSRKNKPTTTAATSSEIPMKTKEEKKPLEFSSNTADIEMSTIYDRLYLGLQVRELCDWMYYELSASRPKQKETQEELALRKEQHEFFNQTIPQFLQKSRQKIYYADLPTKEKRTVDKIAQGRQIDMPQPSVPTQSHKNSSPTVA